MEAENELTTSSPDGGSTTQEISYGLVGFFIFVGVLIILFIVKKKCAHEKHTGSHSEKEHSFSSESQDELSDVFIDKLKCEDAKTFRDSPYCGKLDEDLKILIDEHRIDARRLLIEHPVGKGQFGCVYEATLAKDARSSNDYGALTHEKVAVKTIRGEACDTDSIEAFLREGMIMREFRHENVLTLIGVALGTNGLPMIILPHMLNGNLKAYIAKPTLQVTVRELLQFGVQIARGMEYLSQHKFVHRDLAARNCMLDETMTVKVADFGLSRDIYMKEYYSSSDRQAMLPVKWMALESLIHSVYTTKSDVWSFGVLMWELLTRGTTPYPDVSNWDIRQYVQSGRRLHQPESCPDDLYAMMRKCWSAEPTDRPSFTDIVRQLNEILGGEDDDDENEEETPSMEPNYANLDASVDVYIVQDSPPPSPGSGLLAPHVRSDSSAADEELSSPGIAAGNGFATTVEHAMVH